ncbi:hypothetical protein B0I35DRAFT_425168 [Stachybotrys elegans]|uniref:Uncharacterized protein n=1 Tax=Stachybotrys elegans TaxID=80388 RepID=A0A8K0SWX3_9HYPO|nr:hypothetical protein B0I35DRAFT_425168 [Stachybotrys elegans]
MTRGTKHSHNTWNHKISVEAKACPMWAHLTCLKIMFGGWETLKGRKIGACFRDAFPDHDLRRNEINQLKPDGTPALRTTHTAAEPSGPSKRARPVTKDVAGQDEMENGEDEDDGEEDSDDQEETVVTKRRKLSDRVPAIQLPARQFSQATRLPILSSAPTTQFHAPTTTTSQFAHYLPPNSGVKVESIETDSKMAPSFYQSTAQNPDAKQVLEAKLQNLKNDLLYSEGVHEAQGRSDSAMASILAHAQRKNLKQMVGTVDEILGVLKMGFRGQES